MARAAAPILPALREFNLAYRAAFAAAALRRAARLARRYRGLGAALTAVAPPADKDKPASGEAHKDKPASGEARRVREQLAAAVRAAAAPAAAVRGPRAHSVAAEYGKARALLAVPAPHTHTHTLY